MHTNTQASRGCQHHSHTGCEVVVIGATHASSIIVAEVGRVGDSSQNCPASKFQTSLTAYDTIMIVHRLNRSSLICV